MARASSRDKPSIAFLSDYLPRRCGIATFTADLCEAVALQGRSKYDVFAVAINDRPEGYPYPDRVRFEVRQQVQADYRLAAEFLNIHPVSAVCMQHEYGIYGGPCGSHVLPLLRRLRRPVVTTLHTVLKDPTDQQHLVLKEIGRLSARLRDLLRASGTFGEEYRTGPGGKSGFGVTGCVADHHRSGEIDVVLGGRTQEQSGSGLSAVAHHRVVRNLPLRKMRTEVDAVEFGAFRLQEFRHAPVGGGDVLLGQQSPCDARLVRDNDHEPACVLQSADGLPRTGKKSHVLDAAYEPGVLDDRPVAVEECCPF